MNVIVIVSDTFRRNHLGCYGNEWIHTEHLDQLAAESLVFDRAYSASFPTVPNRADILTGRFTFTYFDWAPLPANEVVLAQVLSAAGYTTMMVCDTPHILQHGYNYSRGFTGFEWIRGQENDHWRTSPREVTLPCAPHKLRSPDATVVQYLRNVATRRTEADYFVARSMSAAMQWLEESANQTPFFLYVDTFDPHEPWDPPKWYVDLYDPGYEGEEVIYPQYAPCDYLSDEEMKHMRALYAGEVTLVDRWVGKLLQRVDDLGLRGDTTVFFTTDHGFYHGEHGLTGKSLILGDAFGHVPLYEEVSHIPLIVRTPDGLAGKRASAVVQPPDIMPTILELAGVSIPPTVQGRSFAPVLRGDRDDHRSLAVASPSITSAIGHRYSTVVADEWALICRGEEAATGRISTTSAVDSVQRVEAAVLPGAGGPELYHLPSDPGQRSNVIQKHREVARSLHQRYLDFLSELGTAKELVNRRRHLGV